MKILLTSIGTRGDMEPFLAIGEILKRQGHEITCLFPEQFQNLVEDSGFDFESLGPEFIEMLESDLGKFALGGEGSRLKKIMALIKLTRIQTENNKQLVKLQFDVINKLQPDRIVHNGKALYPVVWEADNPGKTIYISPVPYLHYVKGHSHAAFHSNYGEFLNKLTFKLADWGVLQSIMTLIKWLNLRGYKKSQIKSALEKHKIIYTVSPLLFERPTYWPDNFTVLGYHERNKSVNWAPGESLLHFLKTNEKIILVTFGSMTNPNPERKTRILLNILEQNNIPAIINSAAGGLIEPDNYNRNLFHFVKSIPYDWILPKIYAMIHHGGSGTTHMATKYGCPSLVIPHIIDQFIWNNIINDQGLGPKGIKISKITEQNLSPLVIDLVTNPDYKTRVKDLSRKISEENYSDQLISTIINL